MNNQESKSVEFFTTPGVSQAIKALKKSMEEKYPLLRRKEYLEVDLIINLTKFFEGRMKL